MSWLNLHRIAAHGDGLDPRLLAMLEVRAATVADPTIIDLAAYRPGSPVQAGPSPRPDGTVSLTGNIVQLATKPQPVASPSKRKTNA